MAAELRDAAPLNDREAFRASGNRVKDRTGLKGKALFHPIRVLLTAETEGLELDVAVPALEQSERELPGDDNPPVRLAMLYLAAGRLDEALKANDRALMDGARLLSAYLLGDGRTRIWIITEADRIATTILLPDEY